MLLKYVWTGSGEKEKGDGDYVFDDAFTGQHRHAINMGTGLLYFWLLFLLVFQEDKMWALHRTRDGEYRFYLFFVDRVQSPKVRKENKEISRSGATARGDP